MLLLSAPTHDVFSLQMQFIFFKIMNLDVKQEFRKAPVRQRDQCLRACALISSPSRPILLRGNSFSRIRTPPPPPTPHLPRHCLSPLKFFFKLNRIIETLRAATGNSEEEKRKAGIAEQ